METTEVVSSADTEVGFRPVETQPSDTEIKGSLLSLTAAGKSEYRPYRPSLRVRMGHKTRYPAVRTRPLLS